jgi:hypothetical protein
VIGRGRGRGAGGRGRSRVWRRVWRRALLALALGGVALGAAACAEDVHPEPLFAAVSGSRLALQLVRYDDGTEQATADELYDRELHARCTPQRWSDDIVRCVPLVDDAVYTDAACTTLAGRARTIAKPALFLAYAAAAGEDARPARLFRAGAAIDPADPVPQFYELRDGACTGPRPSPEEPEEPIEYFEVGDEIDGASLVAIRDGEVGEGRLGVLVRESDDGARVPLGLRDRELGAACTPARGDGGELRCAPASAAPASAFGDPACSEPVVVVEAGAPPPTIASVVEASGCTGYRAIVGEVPGPRIYRRRDGACTSAIVPAGARLFAAGTELALASLPRTLEDAPGRRLRRVILEAGGLRFLDDRLFDTATRADCRRRLVGDVLRCIPEAVAPARTLYAPGCGIEIPVTELPPRTCEPVAFATGPDSDAGEVLELRAIGDRMQDPLFRLENGQCLPNPLSADTSLRALGPPLDPAAFVGGLPYGAR